MLTAETILDEVARLGWCDGDTISQTLQLGRQNPEALVDLAIGAMDRTVPHFSHIVAMALDMMDDASFCQVAGEAWRRAGDPGRWNDIVAETLDQATFQFPRIFADDWERLLELTQEQHGRPDFHTDTAWRALDSATVSAWWQRLEGERIGTGIEKERAIALLHSRHPEAVSYAWKRLFSGNGEEAARALRSVGYAFEAGELRALHNEQPFHINFGEGQHKNGPGWKWDREYRVFYPTWQVRDANRTSGRFGGILSHRCGLCHQPLHRLLTLPQPEKVGIVSRTALTFCACLSCLGWESDCLCLFRHGEDGEPRPHPSQQRAVAEAVRFPGESLIETEVQLFAAPTRWNWQDWGSGSGCQNLNRVGGAPSWVQGAEYPVCPECNRHMHFVMQLNTDIPREGDDLFILWRGGMSYSYWCADCRISAHSWQCS